MELTLIDYDMVHHRPSEIAAAALCLSQKILGNNRWVSTLIKRVVRTFYLQSVELNRWNGHFRKVHLGWW